MPGTGRHIPAYYLLHALFREKQSAKLVITPDIACNYLLHALFSKKQSAKVVITPDIACNYLLHALFREKQSALQRMVKRKRLIL